MTSVVGLVEGGISYLAADSLVVSVPSQYHSRVNQTVRKEPKVFKKNGMLIGASGDVRMMQILRYIFEIPAYTPGRDKVEYLVADFIKALQTCLKQENFSEEDLDGNILLILEGEIFTISESYVVCNTLDNYNAIGKSSDVARGALYATARLGLPSQGRLLLALEATEHHTCVVSSPFLYITNRMEQPDILEWEK